MNLTLAEDEWLMSQIWILLPNILANILECDTCGLQ